jgi:hypothetical protein
MGMMELHSVVGGSVAVAAVVLLALRWRVGNEDDTVKLKAPYFGLTEPVRNSPTSGQA